MTIGELHQEVPERRRVEDTGIVDDDSGHGSVAHVEVLAQLGKLRERCLTLGRGGGGGIVPPDRLRASRTALFPLRFPGPSVAETPQVVLALAYSPDGKVLATAGEGHTIVLRDVASRTTLRTLPGHDDAVSSLAFAPDGRTLASGGFDRTIKLWDLASGRMRTALKGHKNWVLSIAYSPDCRMLASGGYDRSVKLWDVTGGQEVATLEGHGASVRSVAFAPDGKTLASGSSDRTVKLWDVAGRAEQFTLRGHKNAVRAVAFAPDGALLASASDDRTIKLWEVTGGKQARHTHRPLRPRGLPGLHVRGQYARLGGLGQYGPALGRRERPGAIHPSRPHSGHCGAGVCPGRPSARYRRV